MHNLADNEVVQRYVQILREAVMAADGHALEVQLTAAFELGRTLVDRQVPPDELVGIHHAAVLWLARARPRLTLARVADKLNRPLMEMSMAYGMAFREQMERRYQHLASAYVEPAGGADPSRLRMGDIFNDFNNLLGSVIGFAEMAGDELPAQSAGQHSLQKVMGSLNALVKAEQTIQQTVQTNERRLRTLLDNSPDIIVRYDLGGKCVFANPAYSRETGLANEQALGAWADCAMLSRQSDERGEFGRRLAQVAQSGISDIILLEWRHPLGHQVSHEMHVVPEHDADGRVFGTLAIGRDVTARVAAELKLHHQANFDQLSGLPNRRLLEDLLQREVGLARERGHQLAAMFIDLDRFKDVNDTLGHAVGDQLLVVAAQRIRATIRESDTVARLSGDEFIVILPQLGAPATLTRIGQALVDTLCQPFQLGPHKAHISASVGIAVFPDHTDGAVSLIGCADQAMYTAKLAGRNGMSFFTAAMREHNLQRHRLLKDLHGALEKGQFEVRYQPIVNLASNRIYKAEALLRWHHPGLGLVPPDQFIPLAEETGMIHALGAWVLRQAAATARRWNAMDGGGGRQIGVNFSPLQFARGGSDTVLDALRQTAVAPGHLIIEITEGLLLDDSPNVVMQLRALRAAGVQVSLDDFGTGYSALSYLRKFNMDYLKIDRSFVRDMLDCADHLAIVEAIVVMARRLGMKVVAEGVESARQAEMLVAAGCDYAQGYLYGRPVAEEAFLALVTHAGAAAAVPGAE
nr:EAL domain-containing protein [uncultured Duganella sp.]